MTMGKRIRAIPLWVCLFLAGVTVSGSETAIEGTKEDGRRGEARGDQALTGEVNEILPGRIRELWSYKTGDEIKASPVVSGNMVVVGSLDGNVYGIDLNGKLIWKTETGNGIEAPALILGNTAYVGNLNGDFYALQLSDGRIRWIYKTEGQISGEANWWKSGKVTRLLVGSYDYNLHCIDAETGKGLWKYESDNFINGAAACIDGKAIFGGCDGFLHMVDIETGKLAFKIDVGTYVPGSAPTANGKTFIGDYDGGFSCVSLAQRKILWKYTDEKAQLPFLASAALSGNLAVTGNRDKHVYCFSQDDGKLNWKFNAGEKVDASPLICRENVLIANTRGDLILLKLDDGTMIWTYETGTPIFGNPAVSGGRIYTGGDDGSIRCYGK